jgi:hypothetical protein
VHQVQFAVVVNNLKPHIMHCIKFLLHSKLDLCGMHVCVYELRRCCKCARCTIQKSFLCGPRSRREQVMCPFPLNSRSYKYKTHGATWETYFARRAFCAPVCVPVSAPRIIIRRGVIPTCCAASSSGRCFFSWMCQ